MIKLPTYEDFICDSFNQHSDGYIEITAKDHEGNIVVFGEYDPKYLQAALEDVVDQFLEVIESENFEEKEVISDSELANHWSNNSPALVTNGGW